MRANNKIYHIDCFRCIICNKHLAPGDEYSLRDDDLFCKTDSNNNVDKHSNNSTIISNTCQNITNMPLNSSKIIIKCEDLNNQAGEFNGEKFKFQI